MSGCPIVLSSCFKGPTAPGAYYLRSPFSSLCAFVSFQNTFLTRLAPKGLKMASEQPKITNIWKTHHQNAPTIKTCKKTVSGRGQTSEINDSQTVSAVFSEAQGSQKAVQMTSKIDPRAPQITKKVKKRAFKKHQKHNTRKVGYCLQKYPKNVSRYHTRPKCVKEQKVSQNVSLYRTRPKCIKEQHNRG